MRVLLLTPPLTQLNTPYPATAYISGFLRSKKIDTDQGDLGLDLFLRLFTRAGLSDTFEKIEAGGFTLDDNCTNMVLRKAAYIGTIEHVISFLQNNQSNLAQRIIRPHFLPRGKRFEAVHEIEYHFGKNSVQDQARYLASLYLEDLVDLVAATVGPHLGISKYAERIARTAVSFRPIALELQKPNNSIDNLLWECTAAYFSGTIPDVVGFTVPFAGNLYGALKAAQWIKTNHPQTKIILGGGYANTELRELTDPAIFNYIDFITLDDGEGPLYALIQHLKHPTSARLLKRTYALQDGKVVFEDNLIGGEFGHATLPAPDYRGLRLREYLSMFDMPNPMHRLWNDGRWNKLTVAHGCYWKKCSFCDVSLDYIGRFEESSAATFVDKMEYLIAQTGETGFHFVDEAAPPLALRDIALEIIRRGLQVTWWTNIRFEKTFSSDLCRILAMSGCIAVTGGLEVASDRLLALMEKGVTVKQVANVCKGFTDAGILVHAYLMFGFPTETEQETIDSLEIVRQLFSHNLIQSAFWHQFAMTVHSPVGLNPSKYHVERIGPDFEGFANNDLYHNDPTGADHEAFGPGLNTALYNYLHGNGLSFDLQAFFDFDIPPTTVPPTFIAQELVEGAYDPVDRVDLYAMWHQVHIDQLPISPRDHQVTFTHPHGEEQLVLSSGISGFIAANKHLLEIQHGQGMSLTSLLQQLADSANMHPTDIVKSAWWLRLRKSVLTVLRQS
ncbi:MAG: radical SAM protein [Cryomorphaceae bacterium]|nr:radical SAM protein [Cryomorphaceae bacterium]